MSEERTNMAIRDLKHYVIDNMSLDVQDDFEIICKYITSLQQKVEQLENIRKEAIEYVLKNKLYKFKYDDEELFEITTDKKAKDDLLNILKETIVKNKRGV